MSKIKIPNQKAKYKALNARLNRYILLVQNIYDAYNHEASKIATMLGYDGEKQFSFSDYPTVKQQVQNLFSSWRRDITATITTGMSNEWGNSNLTQDLLADKVLSYYYGKEHGRRARKYYQTNSDALKAFKERKDKGMNLSQKIWKQSEDYKTELEAALSTGIQKGMSAVTLSKRVSKYLQDFDLLKKDYKQKYGKETDALNCEYRSIRLARSEINMAYRTAEQKRWEQFDFVVGYEIKLSHVHHIKMPHGDICDTLAGKYPKDFKWTGWHPNDMCYAIPILKTEDEFFELDETSESENAVTDVPDSLKEWVIENEERIKQAKKRGTLPYWLRDNNVYTESFLRKNQMALQRVRSIGISELTSRELNQFKSSIKELSTKVGIFRKNYHIRCTELSGGTLMEWKDNTLSVSTKIFQLENGQRFCPVEDLKSAITKLKSGKTLNFLEEYSIECLFHESIHARATKIFNIVSGSLNEKIVEVCTQLYARERYVKILQAYNINAINFDRIKYEGLGYNLECSKLRPYFIKDNKLQVGELINIANETENGVKILVDKLIKNGSSLKEARIILKNMLL